MDVEPKDPGCAGALLMGEAVDLSGDKGAPLLGKEGDDSGEGGVWPTGDVGDGGGGLGRGVHDETPRVRKIFSRGWVK